MSTLWMVLARAAFSMLITAIGKIPADQWAKLGGMLAAFLQSLADRLPAGHPAFAIFQSYRAPASMIATPKPDDETWAN